GGRRAAARAQRWPAPAGLRFRGARARRHRASSGVALTGAGAPLARCRQRDVRRLDVSDLLLGKAPMSEEPMSATTFAVRVLRVVARIPAGRVATYGDVARLAGRPGAARAVGSIMRT